MTDASESKVTIRGHDIYDGDYPINFEKPFTMRELHILKRISGARAGELAEAFKAGDSDVLLAVAVIAVRRLRQDWEGFEPIAWEAESGLIEIVFPEDDADIPPSAPQPQHAERGSGSESKLSSGEDSRNGSGNSLAKTPSPTGISGSDTSPISDPATLTT